MGEWWCTGQVGPWSGSLRQMRECLNVKGASKANSAKIILYTCASMNDEWIPINKSTGNDGHDYYELRNRNSGLCLNVNKASTAVGAEIIQYSCSTSAKNEYFSWGGPAA
jgi:hypothetical protein